MKYIISRYNQDIDWLKDYSSDYVLYDRSEIPLEGSIVVPNIGSDWYDKFTYIIDNYDTLPDVAVYTKANLFKYISKEEWDKICTNTEFTPILTQQHKTSLPISFYKDGIYHEINNYWYLNHLPAKKAKELIDFLGIRDKEYLAFAPGSNYILPKKTILKYPKEFYQKLRSFIDYAQYPGEAQIIERAMYSLWS